MRPHIEYCLCIWGKSKSGNKIQKLQDKILRYIANKRKISHIAAEYPRFNILRFYDMYELSILKQVKKMFNHKQFLKRIFQEKPRTRMTRAYFNTELMIKKPPLAKYHIQITYMLPYLWNNKFARYRDISIKMATKLFISDRISAYTTEVCRVRNCYVCRLNS